MDASAMIGAAAGFVTVAGPVLVFLLRVEHRLTNIEATVRERMPARAAP
jgi:hypothetical protein